MYFLKAIEGTMQRDGKTINKNFTDECEWRYIPDFSNTNFPQAILKGQFQCINNLNIAIMESKAAEFCWL